MSQPAKQSVSEQDPLFSASYTKGASFDSNNGGKQNATYSACNTEINETNDKNNRKQKASISLHHIILLQIGQIFNYLGSKSYKIYSGFIHYDLGISYKLLTYTVFVSGYISIINLLISKYYSHIPCNIFICCLFISSALSSLLLYLFYESTFIIFLSRPLLSISTMGMWNYVLSLIINVIDDKTTRTMYMSWWNTSYPISTFFLVITGVIIHNLSYFDYLLYSAIISIAVAIVCIFILPRFTIYSLSQEHRTNIDKQIKQNIVWNMFDICSNNKSFLCMMIIAAMDSLILSAMNLLIGPYLKDNYTLNAQQLGPFYKHVWC